MTIPDPEEFIKKRLQKEIEGIVSEEVKRFKKEMDEFFEIFNKEKERLEEYKYDELLSHDFDKILYDSIVKGKCSVRFKPGSFMEYASVFGASLEDALVSLRNRIPALRGLGDNDKAYAQAIGLLEQIEQDVDDLWDMPINKLETNENGIERLNRIWADITMLSRFVALKSGETN